MSAQIEGMQQLMQRLEQMGQSIEADLKEKALVAGAELMRDKVAEIVPVRTGKLKDNIIISNVEGNTIHIGPDQQGTAFHGHFLEFGTKKMSAQPFMGPAYENNKDAVQNKMADVIKGELGL